MAKFYGTTPSNELAYVDPDPLVLDAAIAAGLTDTEILRRYGYRLGVTKRRRLELDVQPTHWSVRKRELKWINFDHVLGLMSDASVANLYAVSEYVVASRRRSLGIAAKAKPEDKAGGTGEEQPKKKKRSRNRKKVSALNGFSGKPEATPTL